MSSPDRQLPPAWRYPLLSLGSTLFGIVLNFGVLNLFMSRFTGMTAGQIRLRWNAVFLVASLTMAALLFRLAS
ncbi:hypothetical protein ACR80S_17000 [Halomonas sp. MA07-2]|uniref:hypothetical protein n=1 Tax=Halomonas sp. MA07-2 TaxID=3440841 RepID=UPI003EE9A603